MNALHRVLCVLLIGLTTSLATAEDNQNSTFELAPIDTAAPESDSFVLVNNTKCDPSVLTKVYQLYAGNAMVFQKCVLDANYQMFPYPGEDPTPQQIGKMARSLACRALFAIGLFFDFPECSFSGFSLDGSTETLLKIAVDAEKYPNATNVIPTTQRFLEMVQWRNNVNLAKAAGLPCNSDSKLYSEYASNLYEIITNGLLQLTADSIIQYRSSVDGEFSQKDIALSPQVPGLRGSGNGSDALMVNVGESEDASISSSSDNSLKHANKQNTSVNLAPGNETTSSSFRLFTWSKIRVTALATFVAVLAIV